jgi:general nucleoside transport system permease protein
MIRRIVLTLSGPVVSVLLALLVTTLFLSLSGYSAASAYEVMWNYGTEPASLVAALNNAVPLYIAGVAAAFALRMGLFNIGVDGQYRVAALAGAVVAAQLPFDLALRLPITLLVSCAAGALWALVPALLKVYRGVNEVITSILMNAIATTVVAILLADVFRSGGGQDTGTAIIDENGAMPELVDLAIGNRTAISGFLVVAIVLGVVFYLVQYRTVFGFTLQVAARSPEAAESAGIKVNRRIIWAMLGSGAIAGLIGLPHVLGTAHRFDGTLPTDLMFTGLAAALLGKSHPIGMAVGAFILAFVERSSQVLGLVQLPTEVGSVFMAVILLSSAIGYWFTEKADQRIALWRAIRSRRRMPVATDGTEPA